MAVVISIITSQLYWIYNMYKSYDKELLLDINRALEKAMFQEITERGERGGGFSAFPLYTGNEDSSYIEKTITSVDTTFTVKIDPKDPNANLKIAQTALKDIIPPDVAKINEFFIQEMKGSVFPVWETSTDYYDLTNDTLIESYGDRRRFTSSYRSSKMIVMDIAGTMGVKAYVSNPIFTILGGMFFQLTLSIVLIIVCLIGLFYLRRTIFRQWKEEKMRQDSINAMTHEFRRPITAAVTLVSLIPYYLNKNDQLKAWKYADLTIDELDRLTAYTTRIQQISNNEKATISLKKTTIEIQPFLKSLIKKYEKQEVRASTDKQDNLAKISLTINPECAAIQADRLHFANVLDNLIENAIKYSEEKPVIDISVGLQDRYVRIAVKDNGIGLSSSDIKHIFEKYYRVEDRSVKGKAGFGLGLTYVKSIIEEHDGYIEVRSDGKGQGSEFFVYVPQEIKMN